MEFLPYAHVRRALLELGVTERIEGDRLCFALREGEGRNGAKPRSVVFDPRGVAGEGRVPMERERLGRCAERLLHRAHVNEFAMMPAARWRPILDAIAFDLASNDAWLEVDADASLHQNTREPLVMAARNHGLVRAVIDSLIRNADGEEFDLSIVALDTPLVLEWRGVGALALQCPGALADGLVQFACGSE